MSNVRRDIDIEGCLGVRLLPGNEVVTLVPLTFGRYRVTFAAARNNGEPETMFWEHAF